MGDAPLTGDYCGMAWIRPLRPDGGIPSDEWDCAAGQPLTHELCAAPCVHFRLKHGAAVLFEAEFGVLGKVFRIGMERAKETLNLAADLLIAGLPRVSRPNLTPLRLHRQRTPIPFSPAWPGTPVHGSAKGARLDRW